MVQITKNEAQFLRAKGRSADIHMSSKTHKSRAKKYYLTESAKSLNLLNKYRRQHTVWQSSGTPTK